MSVSSEEKRKEGGIEAAVQRMRAVMDRGRAKLEYLA